jgi:hypothetical protein
MKRGYLHLVGFWGDIVTTRSSSGPNQSESGEGR